MHQPGTHETRSDEEHQEGDQGLPGSQGRERILTVQEFLKAKK
jgi:hypothetical protein